MQLRMWMYDLAREQAPTLDHLRAYCQLTVESGYDALGIYLEHRFAYPSAPWAHGLGAVTPEMVRTLQGEFPGLKIVPFLNLLGHMEGFLYTEKGKGFAEERFKGLQACPSNPAFVEFAQGLLNDVLDTFDSDLIHLGGDETMQLGRCAACQENGDRARLYQEHFLPFVQQVLQSGKTPALWGDMLLEYPSILNELPRETVVFNWAYHEDPEETNRLFKQQGFRVVSCPTLHTYNAAWMHLPESEKNVNEHLASVSQNDLYGFCLTTWEGAMFAAYDTLFPAIRACGTGDSVDLLAAYQAKGSGDWAEMLGVQLPQMSQAFAYSGHRSKFKCRLLLESDPFLLWREHAHELADDALLKLAERAVAFAPDGASIGAAELIRGGIEFVRSTEEARLAYAAGLPGVAVTSLARCRNVFKHLEKVARANHLRIGGSPADIERCRIAREHVERVLLRIRNHGDGSLGYLPSFEHLTHLRFVPMDQGAWWRINAWASE